MSRHSDPAPVASRRGGELTTLLRLFAADDAAVAYVHGPPGIGKSHLLREVAAALNAAGETVVSVDCSAVEPTVAGFGAALAAAGLAEDLGDAVVCLDDYDHFALLDTWLRDRWCRDGRGPRRLLVSGRRPPHPAWLCIDRAFLGLHVRELCEREALELLATEGVNAQDAQRIQRIARGHPIALKLGAAASRSRGDAAFEGLAVHDVVTQLARLFLEDVRDPPLRRAIEAAASLRRVTRPVLARLEPDTECDTLFDALGQCSVVDVRPDGLMLHEAVREAIASGLRTADPARFSAIRRAAWSVLEQQAHDIAAADLWSFTADVIFLIDSPIVREAFFPSGVQRVTVGRAAARDRDAVLEIVERHDGAAARAVMAGWWRALPHGFHVVRDFDQQVVGFYCLFDASEAHAAAMTDDPVVRAWLDDLPEAMLRQPRRALLLRRWLARDEGDAPSTIQAACWLDVKRSYLECRPHLCRVYLAVSDVAPFAPAAGELGFEVWSEPPLEQLTTAVLDFGPGSVDAWLRRLVRQGLGLQSAGLFGLDEARRAIVVGERSVPLTALEFGVVRELLHADGAVVDRDALLARVWGERRHGVGSNVVDVVVRSLRKKLGEGAGAIVTVRGVGYRIGS